MEIGRIAGATRVVGQSQGYLGLPIRDEVVNCEVNGPGTPCMVTAWMPTPKELEAIIAGAPIYVRILGSTPPPMFVFSGEPPEEDPAPV